MSNTINMSYVNEFYDHYHKKVKTHPNLYRSGNTVTVVLPQSLIEYSNASAGHSGYGAGARPVGIRVSTHRDAEAYLAEVFATTESLAKFIMSSDCDGPAYVEGIKARHAAESGIVGSKNDYLDAKDEVHNRYGYEVIKALTAIYGRETVQQAYDNLKMWEFETRFGLDETVAKQITQRDIA